MYFFGDLGFTYAPTYKSDMKHHEAVTPRGGDTRCLGLGKLARNEPKVDTPQLGRSGSIPGVPMENVGPYLFLKSCSIKFPELDQFFTYAIISS